MLPAEGGPARLVIKPNGGWEGWRGWSGASGLGGGGVAWRGRELGKEVRAGAPSNLPQIKQAFFFIPALYSKSSNCIIFQGPCFCLSASLAPLIKLMEK